MIGPVLLLAAAGCGYSHGGRFPENVKSVGVPIFENRTVYRDVEFDMTEALIKELELRTPYKVVRSGEADTVLQGVITSVGQRLLSRRRIGGLAQALDVTVTLNLEWRDQRSGEVIKSRRGFATTRRYIPASPVSEPFELARHAVAEKAAQDIVSTLESDW